MIPANSQELSELATELQQALHAVGISKGKIHWNWPGGDGDDLETVALTTPAGEVLIGTGPWNNRLAVMIALDDGQSAQVANFEMNIPRRYDASLSIHYLRDNTGIAVCHKGKLTVGHGSIKMTDFFSKYHEAPGSWPTMKLGKYEYLILFRFHLGRIQSQILEFGSEVAAFAKYVNRFKASFRN